MPQIRRNVDQASIELKITAQKETLFKQLKINDIKISPGRINKTINCNNQFDLNYLFA